MAMKDRPNVLLDLIPYCLVKVLLTLCELIIHVFCIEMLFNILFFKTR
jgi:hypothetical protein